MPDAGAVIRDIAQAFGTCGHLDYGEHISMQEHMLQCAWLAEQDGADDRLIVAALLHDYGHLVCKLPNDIFHAGEDNCHEEVGAAAVADWFDEDIVSAIRLHVAAKRYLCGSNPAYFDKLSEASKMTLAVQGGPMTDDEMRDFESKAHHKLALRVRIYDDRGKLPEAERPELQHYFPRLIACVRVTGDVLSSSDS